MLNHASQKVVLSTVMLNMLHLFGHSGPGFGPIAPTKFNMINILNMTTERNTLFVGMIEHDSTDDS